MSLRPGPRADYLVGRKLGVAIVERIRALSKRIAESICRAIR